MASTRQQTSTRTKTSARKTPTRASRNDKALAARAAKERSQRAKREAQNEKRRKQGKSAKDVDVEKVSIWEKMAEPSLYHILREMGNPDAAIHRFQRKRVFVSLLLALGGVLTGFLIHPWAYLSAPALGLGFYKMEKKKIETFYRGWKFERQLNFSKFSRLVIPYLKAANGRTALYTIFNKILIRTENKDDRRSLYTLMGEMSDNPQSLAPFTAFAERSSGTDMSHLFMQTIFDFQQSTSDSSVIDELGRIAAKDMLSAVDDIIEMKLRRFSMFPTKIVMSSFVLVVGLGLGLMLHNFKAIDFGSMNISPASDAQEAQSQSDPLGEKPTESSDAGETETVTSTDWEAGIADIIDSGENKAGELSAVAEMANGKALDAETLEAFEASLRKEYDSGLYINAMTNKPYTLGMYYKGLMVAGAYTARGDTVSLGYALATVTSENVRSVYTGMKPTNKNIAMNEVTVNQLIRASNPSCTIKAKRDTMTYVETGDPSYGKVELDQAGDRWLCSKPDAEALGYKAK